MSLTQVQQGMVGSLANLSLAGTTTTNTITSATGTSLTLQSNNVTAITIDNAQNVLIGTTTPGVQTTGNAISIAGYNAGDGTGFYSFLAVKNTYASATNPNKYFRVNQSGGFEIINSTFSTIAASVSDGGLITGNGGFGFPDATTQVTAANNGSYSKPSRVFGTVYQNTSGKNMLLMISAYRAGSGNTLYLNASPSNSGFPSSNGGAGNTQSAVAFAGTGLSIQCVILVPPNYYYNVSNDGGSPTIAYWLESLVG